MALPMKKVAAMKKAGAAMKKAGAMKAGGKAMKAKKVSVIAAGRRAKSSVFSGRKEKTIGGLTKASLVKNRQGKVVSKRRSAFAKQAYTGSKIKAWADAVKAARKALGLTGFVPIGGKTAAGKALYAKAKAALSA
uniref:Uncharacterized protein n=1 Tax=Zooxanthella nutricula TaxID=1333877 RepID=A0A7S2Q8D4_9DINO|mmetsp:Transcript_80966/g.247420  ORF Transcript_80966/g.247420 Transcript_80966/m.247420 type:complete len:135 (+) Transcript_80966:100-504(+)